MKIQKYFYLGIFVILNAVVFIFPVGCKAYADVVGTWTATGSLNNSRYSHTMTTLTYGKILGGGQDGSSYLTSCELYNPDTGTWTATEADRTKQS